MRHIRHVAFSLNRASGSIGDKKINEMNDLERRSNSGRLASARFVDEIRVGLQVDLGIILAVCAISFGVGKWPWDE